MAIEMLMTGFVIIFIMMFILWMIHLLIKNAGVVDVGWGLGLILLACVYAVLGEPTLRSRLLLVMVSAWGLRTVIFLVERIRREKEEDKRYQRIRQEWQTNLPFKFLLFFEFQAVLQIMMSIPILLVCLNPYSSISMFEVIGFIIWALALTGESVADHQLQQFKTNSTAKGKVCNIGLWYHSRHPNYFFEWLVWVGIFIFSLGSPYAWWGIVSPALILFLVLKVSGIPLAEAQSLKSRGDLYREYQRTTSAFIPLPKIK